MASSDATTVQTSLFITPRLRETDFGPCKRGIPSNSRLPRVRRVHKQPMLSRQMDSELPPVRIPFLSHLESRSIFLPSVPRCLLQLRRLPRILLLLLPFAASSFSQVL